ncbi:MAG: hypothetical protein K9H16_10295 [Bacteroidales bacterium]|nr:hypothetical protein [Bacteroidales bacterium]
MNANKTKHRIFIIWFASVVLFSLLMPASGLAHSSSFVSSGENKEMLSLEKWEEIANGEKYFDKSISREEIIIKPPASKSKLKDWFGETTNFLIEFWQYFVYGLLILLLAVLIYFVISEKILFQKPKSKAGNSNAALDDFDEEAPEAELEKRFKQACEEKLFARAVRIRFIILLRFLNDIKLLRFSIDKTNRNYLNEFYNNEFYEDFKKLVLIFETVWYGKLAIDQQDFIQIDLFFRNFTQRFSAYEK